MIDTEQRLGSMAANRPCAGCGFNLHGATVFREPHYRLVSVRCPECGRLAALQEYPALTPWAGRLRALAAATVVVVSLLAILVTGLITWGMAEGVSMDSGSKYASVIDAAMNKRQAELYPDTTSRRYMSQKEIEDWWTSLPPDKFLADSGGRLGALNWWGFTAFSFVLPLFAAIGVFWSVLFARARRWRLLALLVAPVALGAIFYVSEHLSSSHRAYSYYFNSGSQIAQLQIGWVAAAITMAGCLLALWAGALFGRPLARWFLATLLSPRLVTAFSYLWEADDQPLPKPR
ncbi:MAG: hypothetical protein IT438_04755 [Phycisphaerales bacterium]|nr:hypothetical protein [Phycisphaerales bacterium]